ncbi:hypothetical protein BUALT_Bualt10G0035700 [Buddleja alternifolia]|uniref:Uncharacterized protein n=1 Tax=Buddleja alternifolia TaxID=168488 RepID=A0AAV6X3W5_9LAMI|nr:hypothetical protein BUALT_Bualt10G0035700 [Buddleja alternifolia]
MNVTPDTDNKNEEHVHNPLYVKPRGVSNASLPNHWDPKSKKGKETVESSKKSSKSTKRKVQSSQFTMDTRSLEVTNAHLLQYATSNPLQDAHFGSQFGEYQPHWQHLVPSPSMIDSMNMRWLLLILALEAFGPSQLARIKLLF